MPYPPPPKKRRIWLSPVLREFRERLGLTRRAFSKLTGISTSLLTQIELHYRPIPEKHWPKLDLMLDNARIIQRKVLNDTAIVIHKREGEYRIFWNPDTEDKRVKGFKTILYQLGAKKTKHYQIWTWGSFNVPITDESTRLVDEIRNLKRVKVIYDESEN